MCEGGKITERKSRKKQNKRNNDEKNVKKETKSKRRIPRNRPFIYILLEKTVEIHDLIVYINAFKWFRIQPIKILFVDYGNKT